jgi:cytochrome c553
MRAAVAGILSLVAAGLSAPPGLAEQKNNLSEVVAQCAACHGMDGIARSADVPHLAGQQELYLLNQIKAFRSGKRAHKEMRYMSRQLTASEMAELARFYAQLPR